MRVEQFVMAYKVEQDRIRALLPDGFESLRPVLRINAEVRGDELYIEFNTPVSWGNKKGWLNIDNWQTPGDNISFVRDGLSTTFKSDALKIMFKGVGVSGGCPAERDNDGCYYLHDGYVLVPPESIDAKKEFCDCTFRWKFDEKSAHGVSVGGKTLSATPSESVKKYEKQPLTAKAAAAINCEQMLGQYKVVFER